MQCTPHLNSTNASHHLHHHCHPQLDSKAPPPAQAPALDPALAGPVPVAPKAGGPPTDVALRTAILEVLQEQGMISAELAAAELQDMNDGTLCRCVCAGCVHAWG